MRAGTGSILFVYVLTHLLNHALGLISLEALAFGRTIFLAIWRNPIGTTVLYGALLIHAVLALRSLYGRRSLHMPFWEAACPNYLKALRGRVVQPGTGCELAPTAASCGAWNVVSTTT